MSQKRHDRSRRQRALRRRRNERMFLFDPTLARCIGEADRDEWEMAIVSSGGDVSQAARFCGLNGTPQGAKALWGRSAEDALGTYRRWLKRRGKGSRA